MTTKAKRAKASETAGQEAPVVNHDPQGVVAYDRHAIQTIPFTITQGRTTYRVSHTIASPSNEQFFRLQEELADILEKSQRKPSTVFDPKVHLWKELVISRTGFKEREDWRDVTHPSDAIAVVNALLHTHIKTEEAEADAAGDNDLLDDDELYVVAFDALSSGTLLTNIEHWFKQESKADMDEYLAILAGEPSPNALASAAQVSRSERLYRLGKRLLAKATGYAEGSDVPPWHLSFTTEVFLSRQVARMGKTLAA